LDISVEVDILVLSIPREEIYAPMDSMVALDIIGKLIYTPLWTSIQLCRPCLDAKEPESQTCPSLSFFELFLVEHIRIKDEDFGAEPERDAGL